MDKVSVITVCYNAASTIEETIQSVITQDYPALEYIIIDGGSTDQTMSIVEKYQASIDIIISEPDQGIYNAMNKGLAFATGEWINFMNAGDTYVNNGVLSSIFSLTISSAVRVIYGDSYFKSNGNTTEIKCRSIDVLSCCMPFCHQSTFVRKGVIPFDETYKICADYKMFYSLYKALGPSVFLYHPIPISVFDNEGGLSVTNVKQHRLEVLQIRSFHKDYRWWVDWAKYQVKFNILRLC